jgi:hypothetical protein
MSEPVLPRYDRPITVYTTVTKVMGFVVRYTVPTAVLTPDGWKSTYVIATEMTYYMGGKSEELAPEIATRFRRRSELRAPV